MGKGIEYFRSSWLLSVSYRSLHYSDTFLSSYTEVTAFTSWCKSCTQTLPCVTSPVLVEVPRGISLQTTRTISEAWAKNGNRWDFHSWCAQLKTSVTLCSWGKGQVQIAVSCHWHPHTNNSGPLHWSFSTCHLSDGGFLQNLKRLVMVITLSLHAQRLLWGWAIQNWFKDLKQQNVAGLNHLPGLVADEETEFACAMFSYSSLTSKCRATLPLL